MKHACDVIVVGAGPAGSTAARLAAEHGLDVLLIDKHQEIGSPVRCAEAIGLDSLLPYTTPDERWINARIDSYSIHNSSGESVRVPPTEPTLIVERKIFDRELAHQAALAGAHVYAKTTAVGLLQTDGKVTGVKIDRMGRTYDVTSRLVIAADGTESQVARWAGLKTIPPMSDYYVSAEYLLCVDDPSFDPTDCQYHLGPSIAPGGYAWVFPKGKDTANVGLVLSADRAGKISAQTYLDQFVDELFPGASILGEIAGGIPITGALKHMVKDGLMVIGDAAHQADPLTAGGINLGIIAADLAVQVGVRALEQGDVSTRALHDYELAWRDRFGRQHEALYRVRKILAAMDEKPLNDIIRIAAKASVDGSGTLQILFEVLKSHPLLLVEARSLVTTGLILK